MRLAVGRRVFTKLMPSAEADSFGPLAFPALPCRAVRCRRYAAGAESVPPSQCSIEFRNSLINNRSKSLAPIVSYSSTIYAIHAE
jgi:hypothetical protein